MTWHDEKEAPVYAPGERQKELEGYERPSKRRFLRTVAVDFDGVIHQHVSKWTVPEEIHDGPVPGAFDFLEQVVEEYNVVIFSARAADPAGRQAIADWLLKHWRAQGPGMFDFGKPVPALNGIIDITAQKPHAFIYIDDRGWHFEGTFPTMEELRSFESWTKKLRFDDMKFTAPKGQLTVNSDHSVIVEAPAGHELVINGVVVASRAHVGKGDTVTVRKRPVVGEEKVGR